MGAKAGPYCAGDGRSVREMTHTNKKTNDTDKMLATEGVIEGASPLLERLLYLGVVR